MAEVLSSPCTICKKGGKPRITEISCKDYPCPSVTQAEQLAQAAIPRRARQRASLDDAQLLAGTDPANLAEAGAFDE